MAFDNVTFFELHLDDARFGGEPAAEEPDEPEMEPESGRRGPPVGLLVILGIGVAVAARRMRRDREAPLDFEEAEPIAVE